MVHPVWVDLPWHGLTAGQVVKSIEVSMRLLKYGWISALGWAALACATITFVIAGELPARHATQNQQAVVGGFGFATLLFASWWLKWRIRFLRWKTRSEAWYEGREEARERWRKQHGGKRRH